MSDSGNSASDDAELVSRHMIELQDLLKKQGGKRDALAEETYTRLLDTSKREEMRAVLSSEIGLAALRAAKENLGFEAVYNMATRPGTPNVQKNMLTLDEILWQIEYVQEQRTANAAARDSGAKTVH